MIWMREIDGRQAAWWISTEKIQPSRRTLVFVHGAGGDHTLWQPQCAFLSEEFQIAAVDLPGHGESRGPGEREAARYAEWLEKLLAGLGIVKPVLIGHSLGAAACLSLALRGADAAAAIVTVGGGAKMPVSPAILKEVRNNPAAVIALIAQFSLAKANRGRLTGLLTESFSGIAAEVLYGDFLACDRLDLRETLARIPVPALVVCGAADQMTPPALSAALQDGMAGARLALIEGAGHFAMLEDPETFNALLAEFVRSLPGTTETHP